MFEFGRHADYMALGYAVMGTFLGGLILWQYLRYRGLNRDLLMIESMEAEIRAERDSLPHA